ncbi:hypothetical protein P43SY_006029 [Pythium insidiosum]|uniref:Transmembrane protein n=1 Tax=Pythium insidiosum TaxID=114742 RepID=A0AAD5LAE2_PYTIN|nr:hypothetical protein P43SY_006029 [Pythium insidiosum]
MGPFGSRQQAPTPENALAAHVLEGEAAATADEELAAYLANEQAFRLLRTDRERQELGHAIDHVSLSQTNQLEIPDATAWTAGAALVVVALVLVAWRKATNRSAPREVDAAPLIYSKMCTAAATPTDGLVLGAGAAFLCAAIALFAWRKTNQPPAVPELSSDVYIQLTT